MSEPAAASLSPPRFGMFGYWLSLIVIGLIGVAPMLAFVAGLVIAGDRPCNLSESVASTCVIDGVEWGPTLQAMALAPIFLIVSLPVSFVLFIVWVVVLLVHQSRFYRRPLPQP